MSTNNKKIKKPKMSKKSCGHHFCQLDTKKTCCICGDKRCKKMYVRYEDGKGYVPSNWWWGYCPSCAEYEEEHEGPAYYPFLEFIEGICDDGYFIDDVIDAVESTVYSWKDVGFGDDVIQILRENYRRDESILEVVYGVIEREDVNVPTVMIGKRVLSMIGDRRKNLTDGTIISVTRMQIRRYVDEESERLRREREYQCLTEERKKAIRELKRISEEQETKIREKELEKLRKMEKGIGYLLNENSLKRRNRKMFMSRLHDHAQLNHKTEKATIAEKERIFEDLCGCSMTTIQKVLIPCGHLSCEECATQSNCLICGVELVTKLSL
eukprot:TRINITY_DN1024_c0_g1_i2.p1 TRINITY_DN1024_c0_g1~~TRINITY_DN1024_c0_g1_i2.p1  ORF type:complete len:325 (-),score=70.05 TRINITY_DN1024_c0_g1_i2:40-1014(-)